MNKDIKELLKRAGIAFKIVKVKPDDWTKEVDEEVNKYVQSIEEAHRRAAKSKLRFRTPIY